jgi:6-phosphogluconolactonase (cycloisomerase 2 family)
MWFGRSSAKLGLFAFVLLATVFGTFGAAEAAARRDGAVYVLTNSASGNAVAVFSRDARGALAPLGQVPTGGNGTGAGLGSQGALALSKNQRWLFAVNAGSSDISVFRVQREGLRLTDKIPSGGQTPISLTFHDDTLYVLNAGGAGNITGFTLEDGRLSPIPGSTQPLSGAGAAPAQVQFSPDGEALVVTEKATSLIDVYQVDDEGVAHGPASYPSAGRTPFGFAFGRRGQLVVSEAAGGAPNGSSASLYRLEDGELATQTPAAPTYQTAACWVAVTPDGRYAYTANAGSASITGYAVGRRGDLKLLNPSGASAGGVSRPLDLDTTRDGGFLYALSAGANGVSGFQIQPDGSLAPAGSAGGLPAGAVGLAAR